MAAERKEKIIRVLQILQTTDKKTPINATQIVDKLENEYVIGKTDRRSIYRHDALSDAANTAVLLRIVRNQHLFEEHLQVAKEALETKSLGNTLGSMFEFSGLLETIA